MSDKFMINNESVRDLAKLLEETGLSEIEYQVGTQRIRVVKSVPMPSFAATPLPMPVVTPSFQQETNTNAIPMQPQGECVKSPMVGTAYLASAPGATPFITVGSSVKKGDTLLIIEAMKVMNPIRAPRDGKVLEILVSDGSPVEFDENLVILD